MAKKRMPKTRTPKKRTEQATRVLFLVGAKDSYLINDTVHILTATSAETGALIRRLWDGDLKELVVLAWGMIWDDELFDEFLKRIEPARIDDDSYRIDLRDITGIYIARAIEFLNGAFVPSEEDPFVFLNDALLSVGTPAQLVLYGIKHYMESVLPLAEALSREPDFSE